MITCAKCEKKFEFSKNIKSRDVEDNVREIGIECPDCHFWVTGYFTNPELEALRGQVKKAQALGSSRFPTLQKSLARKHDMIQAKYAHLKSGREQNVGLGQPDQS
jgi:DNA-directed RNA polymerase subunit RPC12/RpoP